MAEPTRTKWDMIRERKLRQKAEKTIAAWSDVDRSWMKFTRCWFCGQKYCVNNYADRRVRIPKVDGVPMCIRCSAHGRGQYLASSYQVLVKRARAGSKMALKALRAMPYPPREFRNDG